MATITCPENVTIVDEIPPPSELQAAIPLTDADIDFVDQTRTIIRNILNGVDQRLLLIIGPCSVHDIEATLEYALCLKQLSQKVSSRFFIVMRTYFEKPRTIVGWKGMLYDPDLNGTCQLVKGIWRVRTLLSKLTKMRVPVGSELLELTTTHYFSDFLSWGCIGARTCLSPPHRQLAASKPFPIGFKNTIDGNTENPIHAILTARNPHTFLGLTNQGQLSRIQTSGNPFCHVVLRGGLDTPNYYPKDIEKVVQKCQQHKICERILIDCSHDNCEKQHQRQIKVFESALAQFQQGNSNIMGMMLESYLSSGSQPISPFLRPDISITDPCIDWDTTQALIEESFLNFN